MPPALAPADIDFSGGVPRSRRFADVYHAQSGAMAQATHVFLGGNGLPGRWAGRRAFALLELGFGLGRNFLATWAAWRADPQRCEHLEYVAIEAHPPRHEDLQRACAGTELAAALPEGLAQALVNAWPPLTPGVHLLEFDQGRVRLVLALGEARQMLRQIVGRFDAFYLDGFAPRVNPQAWEVPLLQALGRHAAPGATAATWCVARAVTEGLRAAGFEPRRAAGLPPRREMTVAVHAPRHAAPAPPGRPGAPWTGPREALVVGAGLAGAATAWALARRGWSVTVLDREAAPAAGASGNPAGLFHGAIHPGDGVHARAHRAGAMLTARRVQEALRSGVKGEVAGLLSLGPGNAQADECPADYASAVDAGQASALAQLPLAGPAVHYAQGGWVDPAGLVRHWLAAPGIRLQANCTVSAWRRASGTGPSVWEVTDADGQVLAQAPMLVLAGGANLDGMLGLEAPLQKVRGQVTWFDSAATPRLPVTGHGYAVSPSPGRVLCGASSSADDPEPLPRESDHAHNLARLQTLTGCAPGEGMTLGGRVSWRSTTDDRLPLIGAMPDPQATASRQDQVRFMPRLPGLFVVGGFGSRGLTWAPLAGEVIAAWLEGTPVPLEAELLDAVDPSRWTVRRHRQRAGQAGREKTSGPELQAAAAGGGAEASGAGAGSAD